MTPGLTEAIKMRSRQWNAFHAWERDRAITDIALHERISWYASAYKLAQALSSAPITKDISEKAAQIRQIRRRLQYLSRGNRDV